MKKDIRNPVDLRIDHRIAAALRSMARAADVQGDTPLAVVSGSLAEELCQVQQYLEPEPPDGGDAPCGPGDTLRHSSGEIGLVIRETIRRGDDELAVVRLPNGIIIMWDVAAVERVHVAEIRKDDDVLCEGRVCRVLSVSKNVAMPGGVKFKCYTLEQDAFQAVRYVANYYTCTSRNKLTLIRPREVQS